MSGYKERARNLERTGKIHPGLKAALEANNPAFFDGPKTIGDWYEKADRNIEIRLRLGKFPTGYEKDPELAACGQWWGIYRIAGSTGRLRADRAAYLDERVSGWRGGNAGLWTVDYDRHIAVRHRLGRFPSAKETDPELAVCGMWWVNRRQDLRRGRLAADRVAYLDERVAGWQYGNAGPWTADYDRNIAIRLRLGKFPSTMETDPELAVCGRWWASRRREFNAGRLAAVRVAYLDERVSGWQDGNAGPWTADYDRNIAIRLRLGMFPSAKDRDEGLAACGYWWSNRRVELRDGRLVPARAAYLDTHCPGWREGNRGLAGAPT